VSAYEQQEELEQLKAWWKEYGVSLILGVLIGLAVLFGYRYWVRHEATQREAASAIYDQMIEATHANKPEARTSGEKLVNDYPSTPYASMAALLLAREAYDAGDKALAHAKDTATQHAARLRLARLLLDAVDVQAASALAEISDTAGFESEYLELKGDLAVARGEKDAARSLYREALKHVRPGSSYTQAIAMKLDDLGPEKPAVESVPEKRR